MIPFVQQAAPGVDLFSLSMQKNQVHKLLLEHGAILFRGYSVGSAEKLQAFCEMLGVERMDYPRGISPRNEVGVKVYTSTEAPANVPLPIHTEMSYTSVFPRALAFCCVIPAQQGGETPLADMKKVLARLPLAVVQALEQKGILYHQYAPSGHNNVRFKTWQDMFSTEEKSVVEAKCAAQGVQVEWLAKDVAKLTNPGSVVSTHPETGDRVWFNQVHVFHPSMSAEFRYIQRPLMACIVRGYEWMLDNYPSLLPPYPYGVTYGDGSAIPRAHILMVREAIWAETVKFPWQQGDVLLVDNLRLGHGRMPFKGPRKILAALIKQL